ncbi:hypothetical protein RSAG8_01295, partial [Rhizoctonia solani AG-8 WAC10335]
MSAFKSVQKRASVRAPSPAAAAFHTFAPGAAFVDPGEEVNAEGASWNNTRVYTIQQLDSFVECVDIIPHPYREVLRPELSTLYKLSDKVRKAKSALEGLQTHESKRTWPAQLIGINTPQFQSAAEFEATEKGAEHREWLEKAALKYKQDVLERAIQLKSDEVRILQENLRPQIWMDEFIKMIDVAYANGPAEEKIPSYKNNLVEYIPDPNSIRVFNQVKAEMIYIGHAVIRIANAKNAASIEVAAKKKSLKNKADVEMADGTPAASTSQLSPKAIEELIAKSVAAQLKEKANVAAKTSKHGQLIAKSVAAQLKEKANVAAKTSKHGPRKPQGKPRPNVGKGPAPAQPSQNQSKPSTSGGSGGGQNAGPKKRKVNLEARTAQASGQTPPQCWERTGSCTAIPESIEALDERRIWWWTKCRPEEAQGIQQRSYLQGEAGQELVNSGIHVGPGVDMFFSMLVNGRKSLYESLADASFGVGLKYMFPRSINYDLPRVAYNEWCNSIRWKYALKDKPETDFEPELLLRTDSIAPAAPQYIENGLAKGRIALEIQLSSIQSSFDTASHRIPRVVDEQKEFIRDISAIRFYREEKSKIFIVGGDIEAYYPNVPKGRASQIVKEMMEEDPRQSEENFGSFFEECLDVVDSTVVMRFQDDCFFEECLDVADSTVVMRFQDDWYVQTDGLSMGVAHAPDMANLYGSYFENQIIPALGQDILYYEIQNSIREQWDKDLTFARLGGLAAIPPNMNKPLLVARKRTMNLGDLVTRMRKIVLDYNDVSEDLGREVTDFWKS